MNILFPSFTALFVSKIGIAVILVVLLYHLFQTWAYGRQLSGISDGTSRLSKSMQSRYTAIHQKYAKRSFWIAVFAVLAVETVVRFNEPVYDLLFWIHFLFFAVPGFILFRLVVYKYTGLKRPDLHAKLVYRRFFPLLVGTLLTGIPLLYRL